MQLAEILQRIDDLKIEIDALRPIDREQEQRVMQKFWLDWNYHSNAIEGNTLTYGETRAFLLHGITAQGKPFRDYLDMKGHKEALDYLEELVRQEAPLTEVSIRELHKILLIEPYEMPAVTPEGFPTKRRIEIGRYKTMPNSVQTSTGQMHYYATPEETPALMGDLMQWYRSHLEKNDLHPLILAATFHVRFVAIHPFDDGNGRMARLLMNLSLMQVGYVPVIIHTNTKEEYILALEQADEGNFDDFLILISNNLIRSLELYLRGAKGERIETLGDLDKQIQILTKRLASQGKLSEITKDTQTQKVVFEHFIKPLLEKFIIRLRSLETFFVKIGYSTRFNFGGLSNQKEQQYPNWESQFEELEKAITTNPDLLAVIIEFYLYVYYTPIFNTEEVKIHGNIYADGETISILIEMGKHRLKVKSLNMGFDEHAHFGDIFNEISSELYSHVYSEEEIDRLVIEILKSTVEGIERRVKSDVYDID